MQINQLYWGCITLLTRARTKPAVYVQKPRYMSATKTTGHTTVRLFRKALLLPILCLFYGFSNIGEAGSEKWEVLFDGKNTDQWKSVRPDGLVSQGWAIEDGALCVRNHVKGEDIITRSEYANFELVFYFNLTDIANSGIKYLVEEIKNNSTGKMEWNGPEYQIIDDFKHPEIKDHAHELSSTASLYLVYAPVNKKLNAPGRWNTGKMIVHGNHIEHWLNDSLVVSCERGSADFRERMAKTKFNVYDRYGELPGGHIMLTDHDGDKVYFRNIRIRRL